jgi:hypothetical protein
MIRQPFLIISSICGLLALAAPARAQQCAAQQYPAFEFQVDAPATALRDSTHPHPAASRFAAGKDDPDAIIVQFVVDTTGTPLSQSLKFLKVPSAAVRDSVKAVFPQWRFTPSRMGACRVQQLVQTTVVR